jgi:hypothetical protein
METAHKIVEVIRPFLEALYFIASIFMATTVIIGIRQIQILKSDIEIRNKRAAVEKSLEYLNFYSSQLLPARAKYREELHKRVTKLADTSHLLNKEFKLSVDDLSKEIISECLLKDELGASHILNQLEFFSAAMLNRIADEDLVFTPVAHSFCQIVEEEFVLIALYRANSVPFENVVKLYNKWSKRLEVQKYELQKAEAEQKILQMGNDHKANPPIGF